MRRRGHGYVHEHAVKRVNKFEWGWIAFVAWIAHWAADIVESGVLVIILTLAYVLVIGVVPLLLLRGTVWIFRHANR